MSAEPISCAGCGKQLQMDEHDAPPHECSGCETARKAKEVRKLAKQLFQGDRLVHVVVRGCAECPYIIMGSGPVDRHDFYCANSRQTLMRLENPAAVGAPEWCPLPFNKVNLTTEQRHRLSLVCGSCETCPRVTGRQDDECGVELELSCPVSHECRLPPSEYLERHRGGRTP